MKNEQPAYDSLGYPIKKEPAYASKEEFEQALRDRLGAWTQDQPEALQKYADQRIHDAVEGCTPELCHRKIQAWESCHASEVKWNPPHMRAVMVEILFDALQVPDSESPHLFHNEVVHRTQYPTLEVLR